MAKVRTYDSKVRPNPLPSSRFSANATKASFGGGQAEDLISLGKSIQGVGEQANDIAVQYQKTSGERRDKSLVRDALNNAESDLRVLEGEMRLPENREKAIDAYDTVLKQTEELRKKYVQQFSNPRQRDLFMASFDSTMGGVRDRAYALQEKSRLEFEKLTIDAQKQSAVDNAVTNRTDPAAIKDAEVTIAANVNYMNRGLPKEIKKSALEVEIHNLHASVLSALTQDDPRAAQGYLEQNWGKFRPEARETLKAELEDKAFDWTVREEAAQLVNSGLQEEEIMAAVDKVEDPKKADALRKRVKERIEDRQVAREIQQKENTFTAWQGVMRGGEIPYGRLSGQEIRAMEVYKRAELRGFSQESDRSILVALGRLDDNQLKQIDEETMAGYANYLTRDDFNLLFSRYRDLRRDQGLGPEPKDLTRIRSRAQMVTDALASVGVDPSLKKQTFFGEKAKKAEEKTADQMVINDLTRQFERELNQAQRAKGRDLYPEEERQILDELMLTGKVRNIFGQVKEKDFLFQTDEADIEKNFDIRDIPAAVQQQLDEAFRLRGIPATEENIKNYYIEYLKSRKK